MQSRCQGAALGNTRTANPGEPDQGWRTKAKAAVVAGVTQQHALLGTVLPQGRQRCDHQHGTGSVALVREKHRDRAQACARLSNFDHLCRLDIDQEWNAPYWHRLEAGAQVGYLSPGGI